MRVALLGVALLCASCTTTQEVKKLEGSKPRTACIVQNTTVRPGVLEAVQEGFARQGVKTRLVPGQYGANALVNPRWPEGVAEGCDAMAFYFAQWGFDVAAFMTRATVWMSTPDGSRTLARADYDATLNLGPGKYIDARAKVLELIDQMFAAR